MAGVAGGVTDAVNGGGTPTLVARVSGRVATGAAAAVAAAVAGGLTSGWAASAVPAVAVVAAAATAAAVVVEWLVWSGKAGRAAAG